jgi:hypothetical protein
MENITFFYMDAQNYVVVRYICFLDSQFGYGTLKFWHADPCTHLHDETVFILKNLGSVLYELMHACM